MSKFSLIADILMTLTAIMFVVYYPTIKKNYPKAVAEGRVTQEQAEKNLKFLKYAVIILPLVMALTWATYLF